MEWYHRSYLAYLCVQSFAVWSCFSRSVMYCLAMLPTRGSSIENNNYGIVLRMVVIEI